MPSCPRAASLSTGQDPRVDFRPYPEWRPGGAAFGEAWSALSVVTSQPSNPHPAGDPGEARSQTDSWLAAGRPHPRSLLPGLGGGRGSRAQRGGDGGHTPGARFSPAGLLLFQGSAPSTPDSRPWVRSRPPTPTWSPLSILSAFLVLSLQQSSYCWGLLTSLP